MTASPALPQPRRIILTGPSGSGKTSLGQALAAHLNYLLIDTDAEIVTRIGMPIATFFARFGEPAFRALEAEAIAAACTHDNAIVATGGGAVLADANWAAWRANSLVVGLTASPETLVARVQAHEASDGVDAQRPLLAGDAIDKMRAQLAVRAVRYAQADLVIDTDSCTVDDIVQQVLGHLERGGAQVTPPSLTLQTPVTRSDIWVGRGVAQGAGARIRQRWPSARRAWLISDSNVDRLWGDTVAGWLREAGLDVERLSVEAGEGAKSFEDLQRLSVDMTNGRVSRRDVVVALGGGVIGDLAGLVAALTLRGLLLVQVPTSLLAMVDSSVGGKTGINLPAGKNLVGIFNQPGMVFVDSTFLDTLPAEEFRSGMAEIIKHGVIEPSTPRAQRAILPLVSTLLTDDSRAAIDALLLMNVATKLSVVQADEREDGLRMLLNLGHTAGHAIESDGYRHRHGEAVAMGLLVAFRIAQHHELVDESDIIAIETVLHAAGLPTRIHGHRVDDIVAHMAADKKLLDGQQRWILPLHGGGAEIRTGVSLETVRAALRASGAE